jgi:hypothetical protein
VALATVRMRLVTWEREGAKVDEVDVEGEAPLVGAIVAHEGKDYKVTCYDASGEARVAVARGQLLADPAGRGSVEGVDDLGGDATGDAVGGDLAGDDRPGGDDGVVADAGAG